MDKENLSLNQIDRRDVYLNAYINHKHHTFNCYNLARCSKYVMTHLLADAENLKSC